MFSLRGAFFHLSLADLSGTARFHNYRSFVFFLGFGGLGCLYAAACDVLALFVLPSRQLDSVLAAETQWVTVSLVVAGALGVALSGFFVYHVYLCISAQTTIEFLGAKASEARGNPYDFGWKRNLVNSLGPTGRCFANWLIPFYGRRLGDGIHWKVACDSEEVV
jgi:hypothetical protein